MVELLVFQDELCNFAGGTAMKSSKDAIIIHLFAILHAGVALACRAGGVTDDIALTLLTMLLVVIICLRRGLSEKFMAASIVVVNILGFFIAKGISAGVGLFSASPLVINPISTFITTEIIGWGIWFCGGMNKEFKKTGKDSLRWLLVAFLLIISVRLAILLKTDGINSENIVMSIIFDYIFSCGVLIFLAEYAIRINEKAAEEQEKARLAQYRYMKLSQQVNPHFLFNSLNILDCLVCEKQTEPASEYIHKLANIYRYLLKNEEEKLVTLRDEMAFVSQYVDLLKVRFQEGLDVTVDIPDALMTRKVVPCSIQLLIENATKHNAISPDKPLRISLTCPDGEYVTVTNSLRPKVTAAQSTGLGLNYLREQYNDLAGKEVIINKSEEEYCVKIPLL